MQMNQNGLRYPVGVETFSEIREGDYVYVDKTRLIYELTRGKYAFLSRPRRFGKSLLLTTIEAYFNGCRELFTGLAIDELETEWRRHPVLLLNLAAYNPDSEGSLESIISGTLGEWERIYGRRDDESDLSRRFHNIILSAYERTGEKVVVLVDEYDSPLVENLHDSGKFERYRNLLKSIYVNLKICDRYLRFGMLTGVSRFSKMTVFSGTNHLRDISLLDRFAEICGITEQELKICFNDGIQRLADSLHTDVAGALAALKANYDGYHFTACGADVYNPFSVLNALNDCCIRSYWFLSGTPTFLVKRIQRSGEYLPEMFSEKVADSELAQVDTHSTSPLALMFQTGYLTIKGYDTRRHLYRLGIPNREVREGLFKGLGSIYLNHTQQKVSSLALDIRIFLEDGEVEKAMEHIRAYLAGIPYELSNGMPEIYFENNLYILFNIIGIDASAEWHTSAGRIDMLLRMPDYIYIMELKLEGSAEEALAQIDEKGYALQFEHDGRRIIKIGINFSKKTRNIDSWVIKGMDSGQGVEAGADAADRAEERRPDTRM